jgi:NAD-binding of NADP-dependent 3-hydroxyisobutyrate dehydrogenase
MEHMHPVPGIVDGAASSRQYAPGFMTDLMAKDLALAVNAAREKRVPVAVAAAAQQLYRMASSHGLARGFLRCLQIPQAVERRRPSPARGRLPAAAWLFLQRIYSQPDLPSTT